MEPLQIKARLIELGVPIKDIAAIHGVGTSTVSKVIRGHRTSRRIMESIAYRMDLEPEAVFSNYPRERAA